jgi:hypothetical protein
MDELTGPEPPEPTKKVRADALERADTAWRARVAGAAWAEAAKVAGYSSDKHAIDGVRNVFGAVPQIDREELRRLWRDRLERSWRQCVADMADRVPGATTASVRIAQAAIALDGLDEPTKVDLQVSQVFDGFLKELGDAGYLGS